ncbi:MAG: hypothetical protein VKJ85_08290 [Prochlorothrix sp.]|nr:hypothetical protein [Prochlorothrix sp.]
MAHSPDSLVQQLQNCIALTHDLDRHEEANAQFKALQDTIVAHIETHNLETHNLETHNLEPYSGVSAAPRQAPSQDGDKDWETGSGRLGSAVSVSDMPVSDGPASDMPQPAILGTVAAPADGEIAETRDPTKIDRPELTGDEAAEALALLWQELIRARRSAILWQQSCDLERGLTDRIAESHVQLQQNYMRLIQEQ